MALGTDYDKLCPLFDFNNSGGVLFPYFPMSLGHQASNLVYINLDGADNSTILGHVKFPFDVRLITCQATAVSDDQGTKGAAASTEPVIGIAYGTAPLASAEAGTSCGVITCDLTGDIGKFWEGTTTPVTLSSAQEVVVYLKTTGVSATSANVDGGAVPVLWFAVVNCG